MLEKIVLMPSETSLEGWKQETRQSLETIAAASETSLEGWKRVKTRELDGTMRPSETSLEGWKHVTHAMFLARCADFRNFLRGMETGLLQRWGPRVVFLPKLH